MARPVVVGAVLLSSVAFGGPGDAPSAFHAAVQADGPDLWYRFDESGGATTVNYGALGPGYNAAIVNGPQMGVATLGGDTGYGFDGPSRQYIESVSSAPPSYLGNPTFTVEAVVRVRSIFSNVGWPPFLHWGQAGTGRSVYFSLSQMSVDRVYAGFYNAGLRTSAPTPVDEWMHVVWVRDSAGGSNNALVGTTVYINGRAVGLEPDPFLCCNASTPAVEAAPFRVQRADDFTRYFSGDVDEIVLYPRALQEAEVVAHYFALGLCYADCDGSQGLDVFDFLCFQDAFVQSDPYADCDGSGVLDIFDFLCFQDAFATGCP